MLCQESGLVWYKACVLHPVSAKLCFYHRRFSRKLPGFLLLLETQEHVCTIGNCHFLLLYQQYQESYQVFSRTGTSTIETSRACTLGAGRCWAPCRNFTNVQTHPRKSKQWTSPGLSAKLAVCINFTIGYYKGL